MQRARRAACDVFGLDVLWTPVACSAPHVSAPTHLPPAPPPPPPGPGIPKGRVPAFRVRLRQELPGSPASQAFPTCCNSGPGAASAHVVPWDQGGSTCLPTLGHKTRASIPGSLPAAPREEACPAEGTAAWGGRGGLGGYSWRASWRKGLARSGAGREHSGKRWYLSSYLSTWLQGPLLPAHTLPPTQGLAHLQRQGYKWERVPRCSTSHAALNQRV